MDKGVIIMFERQIKSQLSSKVVKVITIVFVTLFVLSCVIALSGCSKGDNTIQNHEWKFDIVQGTANDGAVIACSKDSQWVSETAKIIVFCRKHKIWGTRTFLVPHIFVFGKNLLFFS